MDKTLFDSHTHINNETYTEEERKSLIAEIETSRIAYAIDIGFDLPSSYMAAEHGEKYEWCYAAVGCHPHDAHAMTENKLEEIANLAKREKVKAIGEIGLDFHYEGTDKEAQEKWFRKQIRLANQLKMPIVIHSRDADKLVMDILVEEGAFSEERKSWFSDRETANPKLRKDARVLLHCYSGSSEMAEEYVRLGGTISIAGPVTYRNAKRNIKVVEAVPLDFLLIETDAPYLTPEPHRGKPNKSPYVEYTAKKVAEIKGITFEEAAEITMRNGKHFFNI